MNLLRVPAKDASAYGRALLDLLFTKQEQKASVVLKSKKTPLDSVRVEKMFGKHIIEGVYIARNLLNFFSCSLRSATTW